MSGFRADWGGGGRTGTGRDTGVRLCAEERTVLGVGGGGGMSGSGRGRVSIRPSWRVQACAEIEAESVAGKGL